jgi:hypothetical protein
MLFLSGNGAGHVQSLILAGVLMGAGLLFVVAGLVGDLISVNRKLLEKLDWRTRMLGEQIENLKRERSSVSVAADNRREALPSAESK